MTDHFLNSTERYHREEITSLHWELTVCEMLSRGDSPCRRFLRVPSSFGGALRAFLSRFVAWDAVGAVLEVGGGYGSLMRDLLAGLPAARACMMDISPFLLARQREALFGRYAEFIEGDFFACDRAFLRRFDLAILNENLGDFPTACGLTHALFEGERTGSDIITAVRGYFTRYGLQRPAAGEFAFNLGAVRAVERLCGAGIRCVYLSEHSCEARLPESFAGLIAAHSAGDPERIRLRGHDEYTIRFSYLEQIARAHGYRTHRGPFADFLDFEFSPEVRFIVTSRASMKDEHEAVRHFIEDLYKYEYLVLVKE
ncbi:MAG: class I SAM-dependent methyltransferase [Spirochaetes bacterium]|nr:MAG: class I SAM-dependent methyltransferase [Spirochaetota bacterium]